MRLEHFCDLILYHHGDCPDIRRLIRKMNRGDLSVRFELGEKIREEPQKLPPAALFEINRWGTVDHLSTIKEIRMAGRLYRGVKL